MNRLLSALVICFLVSPGAVAQPGIPTSGVPDSPMVFIEPEVQPEFPGNIQVWISRHLRYPREAGDLDRAGKVIVRFKVLKNGKVARVQLARSSGHPALDREALRLIRKMPRWKPGTFLGKPADFDWMMPVVFKPD